MMKMGIFALLNEDYMGGHDSFMIEQKNRLFPFLHLSSPQREKVFEIYCRIMH